VKINITTASYVYYEVVHLKLRYEYPITLILHKTLVTCVKNRCLNKFIKKFGRTTTHNFIKIKIITPDDAYYKIFLLKLRYE
jgi:hypothetical protein